MKNYRKNTKQSIPVSVCVSSKTGIPLDTLGGYPQITIRYGREFTVEGSCRITEYSPEVLKILCKGVAISVTGKNICVRLMDELALVANGEINSICFEE